MASMIRYQPIRIPLGGMAREFDRVFERFFDDTPAAPRAAGRLSGTAANLYETEAGYWVELPLPGVRPEDVEITAQENVLQLKAKRAWQTPENARTIWQGFSQGEWQQSFTLPGEVDASKVEATLEHGMLRLELPKAEHARPRTIRINAGSNGASAQTEAAVSEA